MMEINNTWIQQSPQYLRDWVQELEEETARLDQDTIRALSDNREYQDLNTTLQGTIQREITNLIRVKLNNSPETVEIIKKQLDIINDVKNSVQESQRRSLSELNDYIQNYPQLTFEEYRRLKNEGGRDKIENK